MRVRRKLEDLLVTPVCHEIAHERTSLEFPREAILGAGLITIDECSHSQTARSERVRVLKDLDILAPAHVGCRFLQCAFDERLGKGRTSSLRKLAAVFVTETLITGTLNHILLIFRSTARLDEAQTNTERMRRSITAILLKSSQKFGNS